MKQFNKYKSVIWYGVIFVGLIVVTIVEFQFFAGKISAQAEQESTLNEQITVLQNRKNALAALTPDVFDSVGKIVTVLPSQNASLVVTSQVRRIAVESGVTLRDLAASAVSGEASAEDATLNSIQVGMIAEGPSVAVLNFISRLPKLAPVLVIDSITASNNAIATVAQISATSYWSPLPTVLPAITEPVLELSDTERELLRSIDDYTLPVVTDSEEVPPVTDVSPNPFGSSNLQIQTQ